MTKYFSLFATLLFVNVSALTVPISAASADQLQYLIHPQEGLSAFETLPNEATKTIDIATFIFEPCHSSTQMLMDTLAKKAKAGVRVRVLLDAFMQSASNQNALINAFTRSGIQLRLYNRFNPNDRMHIKMLVVDGTSYIVGGRNISDDYFGLGKVMNFTDRDLLVRGASGAQATLSFEELWKSANTSAISPTGQFAGWRKFCPKDSFAQVGAVRTYVNAHAADLLSAIPSRTCANVHVYTDAPDFKDSKYSDRSNPDMDGYMNLTRLARKRASNAMVYFIYQTRSYLRMENWVYMPIGYLKDIFVNLRGRRVPINVFTNQDLDGGPDIYRQAMEYEIQKASDRDGRGAQSITRVSSGGANQLDYELTPKDTQIILHGKASTRDGRDVLVGSYNLDARSFGINLESLVNVTDCADLAHDVESGIDMLKAAHDQDLRSGKASPMEEISIAAKMFAELGLGLF